MAYRALRLASNAVVLGSKALSLAAQTIAETPTNDLEQADVGPSLYTDPADPELPALWR